MTRSEAAALGSPHAPGRWAGITRPWLVLVAWLVLLHVILYLRLPWFVPAAVQSYLVQPLLWLATAALAFWLWRRHGEGGVLPAARWLLPLCALAGVLQVTFYVLTGVLRGFGATPYGRTPSLIAMNLWFGGARLLGVELARWCLLAGLAKRRAWPGLVAGFALPWLFQVGLWAFEAVGSPGAALSLVCRSLLPAAAENLLAVYLALMGGPFASLAYRGVLALYAFLSPALPKLSLLSAALLGAGAPLVGWLLVSGLEPYLPRPGARKLEPEPAAEGQAEGA